jgi:hypothetical protein
MMLDFTKSHYPPFQSSNINRGLVLTLTVLYSWEVWIRAGWTMRQTQDENTYSLAERLCWEVVGIVGLTTHDQ